jgi:hypothetical protein
MDGVWITDLTLLIPPALISFLKGIATLCYEVYGIFLSDLRGS